MLSNQRKISILDKAAELCKSKSYSDFTQANIMRRAQKAGWPENQTTKGTLSKYLNAPGTSYKNVPPLFFDVILEMFKEENVSIPLSPEDERLCATDFPHVLSMFMNIGGRCQGSCHVNL